MENEILPAEPSLDASSATSPEIPAVDSAVIPLDASPVIPAETSTPIAVEAASEAAAALSAELEAAVPQPPETPPAPAEPVESFAEMLSEFEHEHEHKAPGGARQLEGAVVSVSADSVFLDIGFKVEGVLPRSAFENNADGVAVGDKFPVSVKGRNVERYYELSRFKVAQPTDWS
jgi:hypothetical protein